ncbi:MAG: hypothetical protein ACNA7K_02790 [Acholeplasmataceae bacterium]
MQFISMFFSSFLSFFIMGHLVYIISGRNKRVALFIFGAFFVFALVDWVPVVLAGAPLDFIIFYFLGRVGPSIMAFLVFSRFTGGFGISVNTRKIKQVIPKKPYDVFSTLKNDRKNALFMFLGSVLVLLFYFIVEPGIFLYILLLTGVIGVVLSLVLFLSLAKIKSEKIILIVGKDKGLVYQSDIDKKHFKFKIEHYFKNRNYIVDPIGLIYVKDDKVTEKHHMFWLATGDKVDMSQESFAPLKHLSYSEILELFKKYEYRQLTVELSRRGHVEVIKNQRIR